LSLTLPVWSSINLEAVGIFAAAAIALFRFRIGMIPVLAASCAAGAFWYTLSGAA